MSSRSPKRAVFGGFAAVARALAHEHRLEIAEHLGQGERSVEALAGRMDLPVANVSQHLQQMRRSGLVASRREGRHVVYALSGPEVVQAVSALRAIAERNLAEVREVVRTYFDDLDSLEPVGRDELKRRMDEGSVTVLDVRPPDEYAAGHLPGALNVTLDDLEAAAADLPPEREIVAYCRGPYCVLSFQAVRALRARGFRVRRYEDGLPEWRAAGMAVVV